MRRLSLSQFSIFIMTLVVLGLSSCSSNQKKVEETAPVEEVQVEQEVDLGGLLKLGDSDSSKAGELRTVTFGYDSSTISPSAKDVLESNADFLKRMENVKVRVEGHCDERGGQQYNLALGNRRAQAVKKFLEGLGVAGDRIETYSYGKERPVAFGHDDESWAQNRRGNFVITDL